MGIEIKAKFDRKNAIFMAGESFKVVVYLQNDIDLSSLAWGCVQLYCNQILLKVSSTDAQQKLTQNQKPSAQTSVTRAKQAIYSSIPTVIFCDLKLKSKELIQFEHVLTIPLDLPPSFKGNFVKYDWYVCIAVQHVDAPINLLQLPIKVVNVTVDNSKLLTEEESSSIQGNNPFLMRNVKKPSIIELVSNQVEEITSVRSMQIFEIKSNGCVFATITFYKNVYKLGDDVIGKIKFFKESNVCTNTIYCLQLLVRIETIEKDKINNKEDNITSYFTEHIVTAFLNKTHFKVPIPLSATPAFSTKSMELSWRLHFEFVITKQNPFNYNGSDINKDEYEKNVKEDELFTLETNLNIEAMAWDYPIVVHSCNPYNIGLIVNVPSSSVSLIV